MSKLDWVEKMRNLEGNFDLAEHLSFVGKGVVDKYKILWKHLLEYGEAEEKRIFTKSGRFRKNGK